MSIAYGIDIKDSEDPYILVAEEAVSQVAEAGVPGAFWVDFFPILKYVPSWFPGAGFQKIAARARVMATSMAEEPFRYVKEQLVGHHFPRDIRVTGLFITNNSIEKWHNRTIRCSKPYQASS